MFRSRRHAGRVSEKGQRVKSFLAEINAHEIRMKELSNSELRGTVQELRERYLAGETLEEILPEAFSVLREAARRFQGEPLNEPEMLAGIFLFEGYLVETGRNIDWALTAALPLFLQALARAGAHLLTPDGDTAWRHADRIAPLFHKLGLSVACYGDGWPVLYNPYYVQKGSWPGKPNFFWQSTSKEELYQADVLLAPATALAFDCLHNSRAVDPNDVSAIPQALAILAPADAVLLDWALIPLTISADGSQNSDFVYQCRTFAAVVRGLRQDSIEPGQHPGGHYVIENGRVILTELGVSEVERRLQQLGVVKQELFSPACAHLIPYLENALQAAYACHLGDQYVVADNRIVVRDQRTGQLLWRRAFEAGLQAALQAKEGLMAKEQILQEQTYTRYFLERYDTIAGLSYALAPDAEEYRQLYDLEVISLAPRPERTKAEGCLNRLFSSMDERNLAVVQTVQEAYSQGQPVWVAVNTAEDEESVHRFLRQAGIPHVRVTRDSPLAAAEREQLGLPGVVALAVKDARRAFPLLPGDEAGPRILQRIVASFPSADLLSESVQLCATDGAEAARAWAMTMPPHVERLTNILAERADYYESAWSRVAAGSEGFAEVLQEEMQRVVGGDRVWAPLLAFVSHSQLHAARRYASEYLALDPDIAYVAWNSYTLWLDYLGARYAGTLPAFFKHQLDSYLCQASVGLLRHYLDDARHLAAQDPLPHPARFVPADEQLVRAVGREVRTERNRVEAAGGWRILVVGRHESTRFDLELIRLAVHPSSVQFFVAMDEPFMQRFMPNFAPGFLQEHFLESALMDRILDSAQERMNGYEADSRRNQFQYLDVLQRERVALLEERENVREMSPSELANLVAGHLESHIKLLVSRYLIDYEAWMTAEVEDVLQEYSLEEQEVVDVEQLAAALQALIPRSFLFPIREAGEAPLAWIRDWLSGLLARQREEERHLHQLVEKLSRLLPLLPPEPNLASVVGLRSGRLLAVEKARREYSDQVESRVSVWSYGSLNRGAWDRLWARWSEQVEESFSGFRVETATAKVLQAHERKLRLELQEAKRELQVGILRHAEPEPLIHSLGQFYRRQLEVLYAQLGPAGFRQAIRRLYLLEMDRMWQDCLEADALLRKHVALHPHSLLAYKQQVYGWLLQRREKMEEAIAGQLFSTLQGASRAGPAANGISCPCGSGLSLAECHQISLSESQQRQMKWSQEPAILSLGVGSAPARRGHRSARATHSPERLVKQAEDARQQAEWMEAVALYRRALYEGRLQGQQRTMGVALSGLLGCYIHLRAWSALKEVAEEMQSADLPLSLSQRFWVRVSQGRSE